MLVVPLQGLSIGILQVRGPVHSHAVSDASDLLSADFRRSLGRAGQADGVGRLVAEALHGHAHAAAERHHHAFDDDSVRLAAGERFGGAADQDPSVPGEGGAGFLPLPMPASGWSASRPVQAPNPGPLWRPTLGAATRLDRPPRERRDA